MKIDRSEFFSKKYLCLWIYGRKFTFTCNSCFTKLMANFGSAHVQTATEDNSNEYKNRKLGKEPHNHAGHGLSSWELGSFLGFR